MNRAERRKATQRPLSHQDLKIMLYNEGVRVRKEAVRGYSTAIAFVLHDKWGFGKVRLQRALGQIVDLFESINRGDVSIDDLEQVLKEECDVEIK